MYRTLCVSLSQNGCSHNALQQQSPDVHRSNPLRLAKTVEANQPHDTTPTSLTLLQPSQCPIEMREIFMLNLNKVAGRGLETLHSDQTFNDADPTGRVFQCVGLRRPLCWDYGFESCQGHGCSVCCERCVFWWRNLCVGPITHPGDSYWIWLVWVWSGSIITFSSYNEWGTRWRSSFRHCATGWKVAGSIPHGVTGILYRHNPSCCTMAP